MPTSPSSPSPLCLAIRTEQMLGILVEWLRTSTAYPTADRIECAATLAEQALASAQQARTGFDVETTSETMGGYIVPPHRAGRICDGRSA